jgi:5-methylcytosine-specific restriction endonuclease McrA
VHESPRTARKRNRHARGYGERHQRERRRLLRGDPVCELCFRAKATTLDHDPPLSTFADPLQWSGRLIPACQPCQSRQGQAIAQARRLRRGPKGTRVW